MKDLCTLEKFLVPRKKVLISFIKEKTGIILRLNDIIKVDISKDRHCRAFLEVADERIVRSLLEKESSIAKEHREHWRVERFTPVVLRSRKAALEKKLEEHESVSGADFKILIQDGDLAVFRKTDTHHIKVQLSKFFPLPAIAFPATWTGERACPLPPLPLGQEPPQRHSLQHHPCRGGGEGLAEEPPTSVELSVPLAEVWGE